MCTRPFLQYYWLFSHFYVFCCAIPVPFQLYTTKMSVWKLERSRREVGAGRKIYVMLCSLDLLPITTQHDKLKIYENTFNWPRGHISRFFCRRKIEKNGGNFQKLENCRWDWWTPVRQRTKQASKIFIRELSDQFIQVFFTMSIIPYEIITLLNTQYDWKRSESKT